MESAISIIEILGTIYDDSVEICATADTSYDRSDEKVMVTLNAFAGGYRCRAMASTCRSPGCRQANESPNISLARMPDHLRKTSFAVG